MTTRRLTAALALWFALALAPAGAAIQLDAVSRAAAAYTNADPHLVQMFRAALLLALSEMQYTSDGTVYVATGDIPAEWLRDSAAEIRPYLHFAHDDGDTRKAIRGVIARIAKYLQIDPYANAFTLDYKVWERKWELDSVTHPIFLAWTYWKVTGDGSIFTGDLSLGFDNVLATMEREQNHNTQSSYTQPTLPNNGKGNPVAYTGMIWSGFRPSDDACQYNYLIPSEMMAVTALQGLEEIEHAIYHDDAKAARARALRTAVQAGIQRFGITLSDKFGYVYAYEVDGLGHTNLMDDANIPSLLASPYMSYSSPGDLVYQNTRRFVLSSDNPYYFTGKYASGVGSPHTPKGYVWPLALVAQGLTAQSVEERNAMLAMLLASDPGDHLLHESFDPNDPSNSRASISTGPTRSSSTSSWSITRGCSRCPTRRASARCPRAIRRLRRRPGPRRPPLRRRRRRSPRLRVNPRRSRRSPRSSRCRLRG